MTEFFLKGARDIDEVIERIDYYVTTIVENPIYIPITLSLAFFVAFVFWFIRTFAENKTSNTKKTINAVWIAFMLILIIWSIINTIDILVN